jgi:hypothetical protein
MPSLEVDIFAIWPSISQMAQDLNLLPDTVYRWRQKNRIPAHVWPDIIVKAARREVLVTAAQLMDMTGPMRRRPRPRKIKGPKTHKKKPRLIASEFDSTAA